MKHRIMLIILLASIACASGCSAEILGDFSLMSPGDGSTINTPLTENLAWSASAGASSYQITLRVAGSRGRALVVDSVKATNYRIAVRPVTTYEWSVLAISPDGKKRSSSNSFRFSTPPVILREVTNPLVIFNGWRPGVHFQIDDPMPVDEDAPLSPWYDKKHYDQSVPPSFEQIKSNLPTPIWDGHEDAIDMYWYAWKTFFSVWVYPPPADNSAAVSNLIGLPSWGSWGSTMIWDSAFILQFARYGHHAYPAIMALDNCYARQHENGFICRESDNGNREVDAVWPVNLPLLAWSEWSNYEITADKDRLKRVFLPLVKQYEWMMLYQRRTNGFYWNKGMGDGMDDSPRNDLTYSYLSVTSVMAMSADILGKMAALVGRADLSSWFINESANLRSTINTGFWDEKHRIYNDLGKDGLSITETAEGGICKPVAIFWPMIAGAVVKERAASLASQLSDIKTFNRPSGTASLSADSKYYNSETGAYWRGSVWPPTQYMVIKGLERCGNEKLAHELAEKYFSALLTAYKSQGDITEFLAPEKAVGHGCGKFIGWGGLGPVAMLFEDIMGIRVDAPSNRVVWKIRKTERHGVENLWFGGRTVSLICEARANESDPCFIKVESDGDFDLILDVSGKKVKRHITKGRTTFKVG